MFSEMNLSVGLSAVLKAIADAGQIIAVELFKAPFTGGYGAAGQTNESGDIVQKMDLLSNDALVNCLCQTGYVSLIASEETDTPIAIPASARTVGSDRESWVVAFDPLDGSSNIDVNVSVGTIFSVMPALKNRASVEDNLLRPGSDIIAAGYILYGHSVSLVLAYAGAVHTFALTTEPMGLEFIGTLKHHGTSKIYSINESSDPTWHAHDTAWITSLKQGRNGKYTARYIGSLVADFHRGLLKGGVFAYPGTPQVPEGKLRLLYECAPLAFVAETAGGSASTGNQRMLEVTPTTMHQRSPLYIGEKSEVEYATSFRSADLK